jgi:hypothetical protein
MSDSFRLEPVVEQAKKVEALAFVLHDSLILSTDDDYQAQAAGLLFYLLNDIHNELNALLTEDIKTRHNRGNGQGANQTR